jgi:hypothetical protein
LIFSLQGLLLLADGKDSCFLLRIKNMQIKFALAQYYIDKFRFYQSRKEGELKIFNLLPLRPPLEG